MTNTLPNLESRLAALESDLAEQKQVNADLRQRVADLEASRKPRMIRFVIPDSVKDALSGRFASQALASRVANGSYRR
ncbi:hypothetical protein IWQ55_006178 [Labrenzia sp. EL_208]|nr:hypothetical protein [Labrenzia sp. EL_132]MBG6211557.1 hypothetical protein [Labrenzia sp. EL_126]MBG6232944.1 hypothetical protein [Labrenzia sp. EL_208]